MEEETLSNTETTTKSNNEQQPSNFKHIVSTMLDGAATGILIVLRFSGELVKFTGEGIIKISDELKNIQK